MSNPTYGFPRPPKPTPLHQQAIDCARNARRAADGDEALYLLGEGVVTALAAIAASVNRLAAAVEDRNTD
ncbi:hypothetical protein AB0N09_21805 [Streptomyces erythrochromogenes]|uniref:hypothetical protein n=1 Tax=Streptomyces erythrochromogenes TaxID=285574 RepID=UPI00342DC981